MIRRRLANALDRRFESLHHRVGALAGDVERLDEQLRALADQTRRLQESVAALAAQVVPTLRVMAGRDAESRRLLAAARADPSYELAWGDPEPLVTVILPTRERAELLRSRSLPAVLGQTHGKLEVLVIGDGRDQAAEQVVRELGDQRVRWTHTSQRFVYPETHRQWLVPRR